MPIRDVLLDAQGNRVLVAGDLGRADGIQAIKQGIQTRVLLWEGEYWLNLAEGVPYRRLILIRNPNPIIIKAEIGKAIAATPDVSQVVAVTYTDDPLTRAGTVAYTCNSTLGTVSEQIGVG